MIQRERLLNRLMAYIQIDSETRSEGEIGQYLASEMNRMGMETCFDTAGSKIGSDGNNLIGRLKGTIPGKPIVFSAHMDTVMPGKGIEPVVEDGVMRSAGATILGGDDKAGIAAMLEAIEATIESGVPHKSIEVVLTIAEEGGLNGAKNLDFSLVTGTHGYVLDSGGAPGAIDVQAPYQNRIHARIIGTPAHAGMCPEEGVSAIQVAAQAIQNMRLLRIDEETTANIGIIRGGETTNIVCPEVSIKAEARSLKEEKLEAQTQHMIQCIEEACVAYGARAEIDAERAYSGYSIPEDDPWLAFTESVMEKRGLTAKRMPSGGGSDTNIFNNNGLCMLNLGIGMTKAHTNDESIRLEDLYTLTELAEQLIVEYSKL